MRSPARAPALGVDQVDMGNAGRRSGSAEMGSRWWQGGRRPPVADSRSGRGARELVGNES